MVFSYFDTFYFIDQFGHFLTKIFDIILNLGNFEGVMAKGNWEYSKSPKSYQKSHKKNTI